MKKTMAAASWVINNLIEPVKKKWKQFRIEKNRRIQKSKQRTFVWCRCGNEMVGDDNGNKNFSFIRDVYVAERNVVHYKCSECGRESFYDFDFPVPIALPLSSDDNIIDKYRLAYSK